MFSWSPKAFRFPLASSAILFPSDVKVAPDPWLKKFPLLLAATIVFPRLVSDVPEPWAPVSILPPLLVIVELRIVKVDCSPSAARLRMTGPLPVLPLIVVFTTVTSALRTESALPMKVVSFPMKAEFVITAEPLRI